MRPEIDDADIGVFAYRNRSGRPVACAVTPYVDDGQVVVTSTLALPAKAVAARREGAAALVAGGICLRGRVEVTVDRTSREFDRWVRAQELRKYPPARSLLAIPGHRCLFPWYVGRVFIRFLEPGVIDAPIDDRCTLTTLDAAGVPLVAAAPDPPEDPHGWRFATVGEGPACVLLHEERDDMADARQLRVDGEVTGGWFRGTSTVGSLEPPATGLRSEMARLRLLGASAKRSAPAIDRLDPANA